MAEDVIILLVEDDDADAELTLQAFHRAKISYPLIRASNGLDALDFLFARGKYAERDWHDLPAVILLDLNLPKISGLEVLRAIRADERTRHLPVVILTTSNEERDRLDAYDSFANSYILKPVDYDQFVTATAQLTQYWTTLNKPPPRANGAQ